MYSEDEWIQLSSIQHYVFCQRQCSLIHVHGLWSENIFTAKGHIFHKKADSDIDEIRGDVKILRSLNIYSRVLGLSGRCDIVEVRQDENGIVLYPVEYKSGKSKKDISDMAQLCAQALCLEEMMNISISEAALFYGKTRRRLVVDIDANLRKQTIAIIQNIHNMIKNKVVFEAKSETKCRSCSILDICMPEINNRKVDNYIKDLYRDNEKTS